MSSESIVTALFLISAVIAAGVLISAIFPAIYRTADTFGSVSHEADVQMRTDIKIVNYYVNSTCAKIWLKNVGTYRMGTAEIGESSIFIGKSGSFDDLPFLESYYELDNNFWDQGETLTITIPLNDIDSEFRPSSEDVVYFAIVLPTGVRRSVEFAAD
jgi:flagellar protein FlaG